MSDAPVLSSYASKRNNHNSLITSRPPFPIIKETFIIQGLRSQTKDLLHFICIQNWGKYSWSLVEWAAQRDWSRSKTDFLSGMLGIAPFTWTQREAAAAANYQEVCQPNTEAGIITEERIMMHSCIPANLRHSFWVFPSTRATAKAAVNVSPAPVVSRTFGADITGCLIGSSPLVNKADPLVPSLTRTWSAPWK